MADKAKATAEITVDGIAMVRLLGPQDRFLDMLSTKYPEVEIHSRGDRITIAGDETEVEAAKSHVTELISMISNGVDLSESDVVAGSVGR